MQQAATEGEVLDLAVIGAGAAGTYVARATQVAHPEWSISLFERTDRIGGRVWSVPVPGVDHRIELGGMRFMTIHRHVQAVVEELGIATHPFDRPGGSDRSLLRGRFGGGLPDPEAGAGYDLAPGERGRSARDLMPGPSSESSRVTTTSTRRAGTAPERPARTLAGRSLTGPSTMPCGQY
jgi:monoamine oxidase